MCLPLPLFHDHIVVLYPAVGRDPLFAKPAFQLSRVVSNVHIQSLELSTAAWYVTGSLPQNPRGRFVVEMLAVFISQFEL
jgi:hypothetical protein